MKNKNSSKKASEKNLSVKLIAEYPAIPEKFFTFTHEGISMLWLDESKDNPIRGVRRNRPVP